MKLKQIKVIGFKSFADKVTLDFHEGVTGIVGPNGCGKSNIADAFRWVMGEQSAKSMRGGKMQDVLFAGTAKRKPLGLAEVSLVFENSEGKVGIPYQEVEITRRYHRDGEAEYLLNGNAVRLKDIHSILIDVGIGKNAYAIFEQGKIDQIIQLGPEERRHLFEEAAGILKFLMNRRETEKKLAEVELNCTRLKDIHDEVQKEIDHLAGEAARASEYKALKDKHEALEEECLSLKISLLEERKREELEKETAQKEKTEKVAKECEAQKHHLQEKRALLEREEDVLKEKEREVYEVKSLLDVALKEKETLQERVQEVRKKTASLENEKKQLLEARARRQAEVTVHINKQKELQAGLSEQEIHFIKAKEAFLESEQKVAKIRREVEKAQDGLLQQMRKASESASILKDKSHLESSLLDKLATSEKEELRQKVLKEQLLLEEKEKRNLLEAVSKEGDEARSQFIELDSKVKGLGTELEEVDHHFEIVSHQLIELKAREKALLRLREEMEGASAGTKELMKEAKNELSPLFGKLKGLWEYFDIQGGFEEAVAAVLRPYVDTLVADTEETWDAALKFAQERKLNDFSLVTLKEIQASPIESSLLKKVKVNAAAQHFLSGKAVVENLDAALALMNKQAGFEVFSQDGYFIDKSEVLFKTSQKGSSVFLREAELKTLSEKIKGLQEEHEAYKARLDQIKAERGALIEQKGVFDKKVRALEMQLVEKNYQLQKVITEIERLTASLDRLEGDRKKYKHDLEPIQKELSSYKEKSRLDEEGLKKKGEEKEALQKELDKSLSEHRLIHDEKNRQDMKLSHVGDESRKVHHALNLLEVKDQESFAQEKRMGDELKERVLSIAELQKKEKEIVEGEAAEKENYQKRCQEREALSQALMEKKSGLKTLMVQLEALEAQLRKESQKAQSYELQVAQLTTQLELAHLEFQEKCPLKTFKKRAGVLLPLEKELKSLKEKLASYKDINLAAVVTLEQHMSRRGFLQKEMGDLTGATEELQAIIQKLSLESKNLFLESFEAIRTHFKKNFQILFEGGEADLELTQPEDILNSGVEIVAKPPGKQMRSIHLLSGGEKCLTAMALLFSIFEVKAAPFCILDEIDAPLDDSNVDRFCKMVKHFADRSQFILITHNKRTMSMADRLYGVSMEEKGVSKILMMEFQHNNPKNVALV